jgi:hypothetical protein
MGGLPGLSHGQVSVTTIADIPLDQADCVTAGSATCTLRAALVRVGQVIPRRIVFNLPGPGPHVIRLDPNLGSLVWTAGGELDGLSQQGAGRRVGSDPQNPVDYVLQVGIAAPLFQTINGPLLIMRGADPLLSGIAFFDHDGVGVRLERGNIQTSFFNSLDGTNSGPRHLTTGVQYVATDAGSGAGVYSSLFMGPGRGVEFMDARSATTQAIAQPVIADSYFGTDRTGLLAMPVEYGVLAAIDAAPPVIFSRTRPVEPVVRDSLFHTAQRNAIRLRGVRPILSGIFVGYDAAGARVTGAQPAAQGAGVLIEGPNHAESGDGGRLDYPKIFGQLGPGILLDDTLGPVTNFGILLAAANARSSLFGNGGLGISLNPAAPATPTPNDAGDVDDGPNGRQNHPVLTGIRRVLDQFGDERIAVDLVLQSRPNRSYQLELFANSQCDPSGHGEGEVVFASEFQENGGVLLTDATGAFSGTVTLSTGIDNLLERLSGRPYVTAFVRDASDFTTGDGNNTSEFSPCLDSGNLSPPGQQLGFEQREYTFTEGQTASVLVQRTGGTDGEVRVLFETTDGTALAGRDYTTVRRDLVFANGISGVGVQIPLRADDAVAQPTREFFVTLNVPTGGTGGANIDPFRATATIRIVDDDISYQITDSVGDAFDLEMDFGAVEYGDQAEGTVTILNNGAQLIAFDSLEFAGTPADDRFREVGRTCGAFLDPNQSCTVTIRFAPGSLPGATPVTGQGQLVIVPTTGAGRAVTVVGTAPPRANMSLDFIEVEPVNPQPGGSVAFRLFAHNSGPADAGSSVVTIMLPPGLPLAPGQVWSSQGTVSADASTITWEVGSLAPATSATLEWAATVGFAVEGGTQLTVDGTVELTDPRRLDPNLASNSASVTLSVGTVAADLAITNVEISKASHQIAIARLCRVFDGPGGCRSPEDAVDFGSLEVSIENYGPDFPEGPVFIRVTSSLCFDESSPDWSRQTGEAYYRASCTSASPFLIPVDAGGLAPNSVIKRRLSFWAPSGPTGPETVLFEVVHETFDPFPSNNAFTAGPIMVVIPLDGDSSTGMCFIATAAYGSWLDPHVVTLRDFRDRWLLTNQPGRTFVDLYYHASPPLADWIATREWARALARGVLAPVVFSVEHPGLAGGMVLLAFGGLWRLRLRRRPPAQVTP